MTPSPKKKLLGISPRRPSGKALRAQIEEISQNLEHLKEAERNTVEELQEGLAVVGAELKDTKVQNATLNAKIGELEIKNAALEAELKAIKEKWFHLTKFNYMN